VDLEYDNLEAARFAINAINHLRGDRIAKVVLESISNNLIANDRYYVIRRATHAVQSDDVSSAIEYTSRKDERLREAKGRGRLDG
jgi:hypothetical protein